jgi:hypothetical protein
LKERIEPAAARDQRAARLQRRAHHEASEILDLQRTAGNAAVTDFLARPSSPTVQRGVAHSAAEFVKDTYNLVHGEKETEKEKDPDLIKDTLEKANERIEQVKKGLLVGKAIAQNEELAKHLEEAHEGMEKYGGYVEKGLTGYKVYKLARAAKALEKVDLLKDPEGGAEAFDEFFSTLGEAGEDVCDLLGPEAKVAKPYFTFLKEMKHFFTDWVHFIKAYTKRLDDAADGNITPLPQPEAAGPKKEEAPEKPVKFDRIAEDLKEKQAAYAASQPDKTAHEILQDAIDRFMASYSPMLDLWKQRKDVGVLGFKITSGQRQQAEALLQQMAPLHDQALGALEWVGQALPVEADKKALDSYFR